MVFVLRFLKWMMMMISRTAWGKQPLLEVWCLVLAPPVNTDHWPLHNGVSRILYFHKGVILFTAPVVYRILDASRFSTRCEFMRGHARRRVTRQLSVAVRCGAAGKAAASRSLLIYFIVEWLSGGGGAVGGGLDQTLRGWGTRAKPVGAAQREFTAQCSWTVASRWLHLLWQPLGCVRWWETARGRRSAPPLQLTTWIMASRRSRSGVPASADPRRSHSD